MRRSLSGYARDLLERRYDGPIPGRELARVEWLAGAEREFEQALGPIERGLRRVGDAYADLLSAATRLEAARQLEAEDGRPAGTPECRRRLERVIDRARALHARIAAFLETAISERG